MSASKKITVHLGKKNVQFEVVKHKKVYTAYDLAQTLGTKLDSIAKTLLVKAEIPTLKKKEDRYYVVVLPASYYLEFKKLQKLLKAKKLQMAPEKVMKKLGIEPGALSPFGSLRGLGVVVDKALLKTKHAIIGAESFTESLRMKIKDFVKMEMPILGSFGKKNKMQLQVKQKKKVTKKRQSKVKAKHKTKKKRA